jgi:uncharacterized low-complexity protein
VKTPMNIKVLATIVGALSLNTLAAGCARPDPAVKHTPDQGSQGSSGAKGGEDACGNNSCGEIETIPRKEIQAYVRPTHTIKHTPKQGSLNTNSPKGSDASCGQSSCGGKRAAPKKGAEAACGESTCAAHRK